MYTIDIVPIIYIYFSIIAWCVRFLVFTKLFRIFLARPHFAPFLFCYFFVLFLFYFLFSLFPPPTRSGRILVGTTGILTTTTTMTSPAWTTTAPPSAPTTAGSPPSPPRRSTPSSSYDGRNPPTRRRNVPKPSPFIPLPCRKWCPCPIYGSRPFAPAYPTRLSTAVEVVHRRTAWPLMERRWYAVLRCQQATPVWCTWMWRIVIRTVAAPLPVPSMWTWPPI